VCTVRQLAPAGRPACGEELVAAPAEQQGLGGQRLIERQLAYFGAVLDLTEPPP
jgi:hypothetical protein